MRSTWLPLLMFTLGWVLLNAVLNVRYPGSEPAFWYLLPSIDVFAIYLYLALVGWMKWQVPVALRVAGVAWFLLARVIRLGDGIQKHYFFLVAAMALNGPNLC